MIHAPFSFVPPTSAHAERVGNLPEERNPVMGLDNPIHIAVLVMLLLVAFRAKRLPEIGQALRAAIRSFSESLSGSVRPSPTPQRQLARAATLNPPAATHALPAVATPALGPTEPVRGAGDRPT
jgi:Sec-independent protein translocase protein TatA